jgi:gamma-glutamyltranspeptidase/glutathione hydrolase
MSRYLYKRKFRLWLVAATLFLVSCAQVTPRVTTPEVVEDSRSAKGVHGMVAAAHPLASQVGVDVLKAGGNAVDAAVAVGFALGVVEPNASGIGGGGLMLIWFADSGEMVFIDSREKAPAAASGDMFELDENGKVIPDERGFNPVVIGGKSVAVPGEVAGLLTALENYGSMSRQQVIQPAIDHATQCVIVSEVLAGLIAENYDILATFPASDEIYLTDGFPKMVGEKVCNTDLANTLDLIAEQGRQAFYQGPVAEAIVDAVQADGGLITLEDLASYEVSFRVPVSSTYRDYEIVSAPPPSSGGAHVIELLNIMENFDVEELGLNTAESIHAWAEAMKLMYADRAQYMADTDFADVPLQGLTSKQYAKDQFERIDMEQAAPAQAAGDPWPTESGSTTHFSVVDGDGNMVAYTKTINHFFASGITADGTGILLNDQMDDFDKRPGQANSIEGGKKPLSSMSPTLLLKDGRAFATLGSPGGKRIISTMAFLISNLVDFDMDIQSAILEPRVNNYESGPLKIEARIPADVQDALRQKGHELNIKKDFDLYFGGAQGIVIDHETGVMHGGADPRRDGKAIGY